MDAAHKPLSKIALILAVAFLVAAPALAQTPVLNVSPSSVTLPLTGGGSSTIVSVTSSTSPATEITFTAAKGAADSFYSISLNQLTTPAQLTIQLTTSLTGARTGAVTFTNAATSATTTVAVNYIPGGSGTGSGTISPSTTSLSFNLASGNFSSQNVTLSTANSGAIQYTAVVTGVGASPVFASTTANSFTVSANSPVTLTVTASAAGLNNGNYQNNVAITPTGGSTTNISVFLNVGGAGGTTGTLTVSPNQLFFTYPSGITSQSMTVGSTSGATFFNVTASSSGGWLLTNGGGQSAFSQPVGVNALLATVNTAAANTLGQGNYFGTLTLANAFNPSDTTSVSVQLSVTAGSGGTLFNLVSSKSSVQFNSPGGSSASLQDSITFSASNAVSTSYSIAGTTGSWLFVQANNTFLPGSITLTANPAGLVAGTYQGSVSVNFTGGVQGQQTYPVTLVVGSGGGVVTSGVAPTSLTFAYQTSVNNSVAPQSITVGGTGTISVNVNQAWLGATGSGQAPGTVSVYVIPQGLTQGTYNGNITVNTATGSSQVSVTLLVSSTAVVSADPLGTINVSFQGTSNPYTTTETIIASDNSNIPITAVSGASWVTLTSPTGTSATPTSFNVTVNPVGLANGINATTITVTAPGAANTPLVIPVVALVSGSTGGGGTGTLTLSSSSLTFNGAVSGSQPAAQTLFVSAATQTSFQVNTSGAAWLSISPTAGSNVVTNQTITVSANTTGLTAGTYNGSILLTASGVTQTVPVSLVVGGTAGGNVTVSPTSLTFTSNNNVNPGVQGLMISSVSGASGVTATVTANTTSGGSWLSAGVASGTTVTAPVTLAVSVNPSGLAGGSYSGTITVTPAGGSQIQVPVTLTVTANSVSATTANGTSLSFNYRVSDAAPASQTISVTGNGNFTATASSTGTWLSVSPASGTAPASLNASINTSGLAAGTYNGTIVVAGSGTTTGSTTINVQLVVTAPLPTINRVTNAASFVSGAIAPGEIITVFGVNIGPLPGVGLSLDSNGRVATTIGNVQLLINGFLSPMVFASATQVSAVVPYEVKGQLTATVQIRYLAQTSNGMSVQIASTAPGVFTANASGTGPAAILYPNPTLATATRGDVIVIYVTGEGETNPPGVTGKVTTVSPVAPITPAPLFTPVVLIDGQPAELLFVGEAPGFVSGALQLNVRIPANARSGDLSLVVTIGGIASQSGVTLTVR